MNRNHIIGFAAAAAVLGLLAFAAWSIFEIVPRTKAVPFSREAKANEYLALDRWLTGMNIPVRLERGGDFTAISHTPEKHIFIQSSLFDWTDEAVEYLGRWIEDGGVLFLVLEPDWDWGGEEPVFFLEEFGITAERKTDNEDYHNDSYPDFDLNVTLDITGMDDALCLKDQAGHIRLIEVKRGNGRIIVSGKPLFLLSQYIGDAPNARLAGAIFAPDAAPAGASGEGWLFIRGTAKVRGLLGNLFRHGNLPVLLVSALVLLVIGFWAVIPLFGLLRGDDEKPGKPLRERFLAEGRFLKRYGVLDFYRDRYIREIKRRLARKEGLVDDEEILKRVMEIRGRDGNDSSLKDCILLERIFLGEQFYYREFPKIIANFNIILARMKKGRGE